MSSRPACPAEELSKHLRLPRNAGTAQQPQRPEPESEQEQEQEITNAGSLRMEGAEPAWTTKTLLGKEGRERRKREKGKAGEERGEEERGGQGGREGGRESGAGESIKTRLLKSSSSLFQQLH